MSKPERKVDPITLSTVWHYLRTTCWEMRYLLDGLHDVSAGIWTARGETIAAPVGQPSQMLGSQFAIRDILKRFEGNLEPGDVILTNDPYHGGHNNHLPDWGFFCPIFYKGELLFMTLCRAHQADTGGAFPGGYFPNSYDI